MPEISDSCHIAFQLSDPLEKNKNQKTTNKPTTNPKACSTHKVLHSNSERYFYARFQHICQNMKEWHNKKKTNIIWNTTEKCQRQTTGIQGQKSSRIFKIFQAEIFDNYCAVHPEVINYSQVKKTTQAEIRVTKVCKQQNQNVLACNQYVVFNERIPS